MSLCELCRRWTSILGQKYIGDHFTHQPSYSALEESAKSCPICNLIARQFMESDQTTSIKDEAQNGYPTVIQFVGRTASELPLNHQCNPFWSDLTGLLVYCGDEGRNDDWMCELSVFANKGQKRGQRQFFFEFDPIVEDLGQPDADVKKRRRASGSRRDSWPQHINRFRLDRFF